MGMMDMTEQQQASCIKDRYQRMNDLSVKALTLWGDVAQREMAIDEMSECIQAICKTFRKGLDDQRALEHLAEEMADVEIMMNQMHIMVVMLQHPGIDWNVTFDRWVDFKLDRLEQAIRADEALRALAKVSRRDDVDVSIQ
jgi:hypothetical protein